jgi:hypothetical protein
MRRERLNQNQSEQQRSELPRSTMLQKPSSPGKSIPRPDKKKTREEALGNNIQKGFGQADPTHGSERLQYSI